MTWILNLIWINLIVVLVYKSGFWDSLDAYVNKRFPLRHLPQVLTCTLCSCWWLSLFYIIISGHFSLLGIVYCLANGHLTNITLPLITVIEQWILKIIGFVAPK